MTSVGNVLWLLERVVYGGVDLVARLAPEEEDASRVDSLLDSVFDGGGEASQGF